MPRSFDLLVLGEINVDLIVTGDATPIWGQHEKLVDDARLVPGGSSVIFACGAARLGLRTAFVGVVGDDVFGAFMRDHLQAAGVHTGYLIVDPTIHTGMTIILSRPEDDRALLTYLGSIAALRAEQVDRALLEAARFVHAGSYFMQRGLQPGLPALFAQARAAGAVTSLDTNWDPSGRWGNGLAAVLEQTDVFLPNMGEAQAIAGVADARQALQHLAQRVDIVAIKRGAEGALAARGAERLACPAPQVTPIDTTGAGDSFDAGFIAALARGLPLPEALAVGTACGSLSTRGIGGTASQATWDEAMTVAQTLFPSSSFILHPSSFPKE
jgi:sugar/nucleoside kinase (ribokinase family)